MLLSTSCRATVNVNVTLMWQGGWPSQSQQEQANELRSAAASGQSGNAHQPAAGITARGGGETAQAETSLPSFSRANGRAASLGRLSRLQPNQGMFSGLDQAQMMPMAAAEVRMPPAPGSEEEMRLTLLDRLKQVRLLHLEVGQSFCSLIHLHGPRCSCAFKNLHQRHPALHANSPCSHVAQS